MTTFSSMAVCIGRFQPPHRAHLSLIELCMNHGELLLVLLGSANDNPTPRNPFSWQQRAAMLQAALPETTHGRIQFAPLRDYNDRAQWMAALCSTVKHLADQFNITERQISLIGQFADRSLDQHPGIAGWNRIAHQRQEPFHSTSIRAALYSAAFPDTSVQNPHRQSWLNLAQLVHPNTLAFLENWQQSLSFKQLARQWLNDINA